MSHNDRPANELSGLTWPEPDPIRAASVRRRCHAAIERQHTHLAAATHVRDFAWRTLAPTLVGAACAVWLAEVLGRAAAVLGL
jgi:hypothetical protein